MNRRGFFGAIFGSFFMPRFVRAAAPQSNFASLATTFYSKKALANLQNKFKFREVDTELLGASAFPVTGRKITWQRYTNVP